MNIRKALFLDRDGIFNELVSHEDGLGAPRNWKEVRHLESIHGIQKIKTLGYLLILVTNQPDVARGLIETDFVDELHEYYQQKFGLDGIYACLEMSPDHPMKKPNPGMFFQAAEDFALSLKGSFHLGDTEKDVEAAKRSGCRSILWDRPYNAKFEAHYRIKSVSEVYEICAGS